MGLAHGYMKMDILIHLGRVTRPVWDMDVEVRLIYLGLVVQGQVRLGVKPCIIY